MKKLPLVMFILTLIAVAAHGQQSKPAPEPTFEVTLHVLVGSKGTERRAQVPASLAETVNRLRGILPFTDYRLETTYLQRLGNSVEYRSVLGETAPAPPVFADWSIRGLRSAPEIGAGRCFVESFRFGTRVPIAVSGLRDESGKAAPVFNYEQTGISLTRFAVNSAEPTVVGTLTTSKPDELLVLVLTVREV